MIVVTGLSVTFFTFWRITAPYPESFVSTRTTPESVTKMTVLPPVKSLPGVDAPITYRLSLILTASGSGGRTGRSRSEEHTSELQSRENLVCRLLLEKKKKTK